jgi:hypothetical protein
MQHFVASSLNYCISLFLIQINLLITKSGSCIKLMRDIRVDVNITLERISEKIGLRVFTKYLKSCTEKLIDCFIETTQYHVHSDLALN